VAEKLSLEKMTTIQLPMERMMNNTQQGTPWVCRSCGCQFLQEFVCTTCGAEKLYDSTVKSQQAQIANLERENAALRQKLTEWASDAFDDVSGWGSYASEYMQGKWHLDADLAKWQARAKGE